MATYYKNGRRKLSTHEKRGREWEYYSRELRREIGKCQWCETVLDRLDTVCHHITCMKVNPHLLMDRRNVMVVCKSCHIMLEPYSKVSAARMLPEVFDVPFSWHNAMEIAP